MADDVTSSDTTPCKVCAEPIRAEARFCHHCNHYQDIRRFLSVPSTVLALLVALLSVLSIAVPALVNAFSSQQSRLGVSNPVMNNETLYVVATNTGPRPGVVQRGSLESPYLGSVEDLRLRNPSDAFVPTGAKQVGFSVQLIMGVPEARTLAMRIVQDGLRRGRPPFAGTAIITVQQSDGTAADIRVPLTYDDMLTLLDDHINRCERPGVRPSYENGCISLQALQAENDQLDNQIQADNFTVVETPNGTVIFPPDGL